MKDRIFTLSDGRDLGYVEYGRPEGVPIFLFHGTIEGAGHLLLESEEIGSDILQTIKTASA